MDYKNKETILKCSHQWKKSMLLYSTVEDCSICNVRKEDWDSKLSKEVTKVPRKRLFETVWDDRYDLVWSDDIHLEDKEHKKLSKEVTSGKEAYGHYYGVDTSGSQLVFDDIIRRWESYPEVSEEQWKWAQTYDARM